MHSQGKGYQSLEQLLGYYYHRQDDYNENELWNDILETISPHSYENSLSKNNEISQNFLTEIYTFLAKLPYHENCQKILTYATKSIDPSYSFIRGVLNNLVTFLENQTACLSQLVLALTALNSVFQNQTPQNQACYSHIRLYAPTNGIVVQQSIKWPFQKGGTLAFWYNMSDKTKQCKIFEFSNQDRLGFEIIMKHRKIYIQKIQQEAKFRLIKNNSTFLCQAVYNRDVKLCIEFEIKKKFFQPFFSINVIMNNFAMNGVQLDSFANTKTDFMIKMFQGFQGKFYSSLILTEKLASQVQQLNGQKGFIYESDIRNFTYLFDQHYETVLLLFSCCRSHTILTKKPLYLHNQEQQNLNLVDELAEEYTEKDLIFQQPGKTIMYDAIRKHVAQIDKSALSYKNICIKKQLDNYGGFSSFLPFLDLLEISVCDDNVYTQALNKYLQLIKTLFHNKTDSIEQANRLNYFQILSYFFKKTQMRGFNYETISKLKQIYLSLNSRPIRQKYFEELAWGISFPTYLSGDNYTNYIKYLKTFYNEDIEGSIQIFGINRILSFIRNEVDSFACCFQHIGEQNAKKQASIKNLQLNNVPHTIKKAEDWRQIYQQLFQIIENIFIIQRCEEKLMKLIQELISSFSFTMSSCYVQNMIMFLENLFKKDLIIFNVFTKCMLTSNFQHNLCLFKALACCGSETVKIKIVQFILKLLGTSLVNEPKHQKQMLALCIKYHVANISTQGNRNSSIKSQQNRDSIDYSEDKLSLNSSSLHQFITIMPIKSSQKDSESDECSENCLSTKTSTLLDEIEMIKVISQWAFSDNMIKSLPEDIQNPGLFMLMELYKGSNYILRCQIAKISVQKLDLIRFSPQLMAWAIEALMIAEYDKNFYTNSRKEGESIIIMQTINYLLKMISTYSVDQQQQQTELSIIKLVFSSVKSKYPDEITKISAIKTFFLICDQILGNYLEKLKQINEILHDQNMGHEILSCTEQGSKKLDKKTNFESQNSEQFYKMKERQFQKECKKSIENCYTFVLEYFILKGDDEEPDYSEEEQMEELIEVAEQQSQMTLQITEKILQILVMVTGPGDRKIINQNNAERNHYICKLLFPEKLDKDKEKDQPKFLHLIFSALQNSFQSFEDMNIQLRKKNLGLIKKYFVYMIQLTQNSGSWKIEHCEQDLKAVFWNVISFFQQKFSQYFYYPFDRHKNLEPHLQNKIRKNIEQLKRTIFNIFVDLVELVQYIDSKGSLEYKSFYELMKPKRKAIHKFNLKNIYPLFWKKADEQIIQFMSLSKDKLKKDAQQKLQLHIAKKRVSLFTTNSEKTLAKRLMIFIDNQRKNAEERQKKSVNFYKMVESQKCKIFVECEQQITLFRIKVIQEEKNWEQKKKEISDKLTRQILKTLKGTWNANRTYEGLWSNSNFYQFSQGKGFVFNNDLQKYYKKIRSNRFDRNLTMPFLKIFANTRQNGFSSPNQKIYANQIFLEGQKLSKKKQPRGSQRFKVGLQFLKRKVIDKLVKKVSNKSQKVMAEDQIIPSNLIFENILWIKPMQIFSGFLKIQKSKNRISFCYCEHKSNEHLSLLLPELSDDQILITIWDFNDIQYFKQKKFMLKPYAVELYFKKRKSVLLAFHNESEINYRNFIQILQKNVNKHKIVEQENQNWWDKIKNFEKNLNHKNLAQLTQKWMKYQISNFDYLMILNFQSGRSNSDCNQYPIFPWIYTKYTQTKFKKNQQKFRDFEKSVGCLGSEQRLKKIIDQYNNIQQSHQNQFPVPHHYGSHYSNLPTVLYYLVRISPYSAGAKHLQGGKFDIPDRLFSSIPDSFRNATTETSDVRQLIPQFFYFPEFLVNFDQYDFGELQKNSLKAENSRKVNHVQLPNGCMNAFDFIENHREGLESPQVSKNIHKWIDLVFGYKNSGKQAEKAVNTFHYLTNENNLSIISQISDQNEREAVQSQMAFYGKTPTQIFTHSHPERPIKMPSNPIQEWKFHKFCIPEHFFKQDNIQQQDNIKQQKKIVLFESRKIVNTANNQYQYLLIYSCGKGLIFTLNNQIKQAEEKNNNDLISIKKQFKINYQFFQGINIVDMQLIDNEGNDAVIPFTAINFEKIAIGGLYGGRILIYSIMSQHYEMVIKNTQTVINLCTSTLYEILLSCSVNGEIIKWNYSQQQANNSMKNKNSSFLKLTPAHNKLFLHERINQLKIEELLKVFTACSQSGLLFLVCLQEMKILRVFKLQFSIMRCIILRYPYYLFYIQCSENHQYCYSINGILLQSSELEEESGFPLKNDDINKHTIDGYKERIIKITTLFPEKNEKISLQDMANQYYFQQIKQISMPDFNIQNKIITKIPILSRQESKLKSSENNKMIIHLCEEIIVVRGDNIYIWQN